jgi:hypothetical protein
VSDEPEIAAMSTEVQTETAETRKGKKPRVNGTKELAKIEEPQAPAPISESDAFLAMIERAARDPSVDIDKMERLFAMRERMQAQQAKTAYLVALAEMQPKLPIVTKRGIINTNEKDERGAKTGSQKAMSKYALWEDINEAITPILKDGGFSLSFRISHPTPDRVAVAAVLGHREGHTEETTLALPIDATGAKNNVQGWGSSVSYGKRYTALALLNISARGEDDDGNAAGGKPVEKITAEQAESLKALAKKTNLDLQIIYEHFKVDDVADLTPAQWQTARNKINKKLELEGAA